MIRTILYKVIIITVAICSFSCNKWLEVRPLDGLIKQEFWQTREQLESAVIGAYISAVDNSTVSQLFKWGEVRGDMVMVSPVVGAVSVDDIEVGNGNILPSNTIADWSIIYKAINTCNLVIDGAPLVLKNDPTIKLPEVNESIAEMRALRGLLYFYLLRTYGEVPLQLDGVAEDTQIKSISKSSQDSVAAQILADLDFAAVNAKTTFKNNPQFDKGRFTKYSVYALQADVYLWLDRYQDAVDACDKIIDSGKFGLVEGIPTTFFNNLYGKGNSNETIFAFQYALEKPNPFYGMFIQSGRDFIASETALESIFPIDKDNLLLTDLRSDGASFMRTGGMIFKYQGLGGGQERSASESIANFNIYRYADVLLMKAEGLAWIPGRGKDVEELVKQIRTRAMALKTTELPYDINSSQSMADLVFEERAREFAFEGKRWFDILRYAKRNNYGNLQTLISLSTTNVPQKLFQSVRIKLSDKNSHFLPIPLKDLQVNKSLVQNPFYK